MLVRNVTEEDLRKASQSVGVALFELRKSGKGFRFRITPIGGKYQKLSASYFNRGRKCHAVCWHGHRDFFRVLFRLSPDAVVITALARYTADNFESTYPETDKNVGPPIAPIHYSECCNCNE